MSPWEDRVGNPEAMGASEQHLWNEIEPLLNDLLDELKINGKIETIYTNAEMQKLHSAIMTLDEIGLTHNALLHFFQRPDCPTLIQQTSQFGLDENKLIHMYIACAVTLIITSTEMFKLRLLFHMKNVRTYAISKFYKTIGSAAPTSWPGLLPYVDNAFRNALSHGSWAVVNRRIVLFRDAKLLPSDDSESEMTLDRFMIRLKNQNVLYQCLIDVLDRRMRSGFFMP